MFVTAVFAILNVKTRVLTTCSADRNPMALFGERTGPIELVDPNGIALGFDKGPVFDKTLQELSVQLEVGDRAVICTDGVVEAMSEKHEEYGDDRFCEFVQEHARMRSKDFVNALVRDLDERKGRAEQHDDIAVSTFRVVQWLSGNNVSGTVKKTLRIRNETEYLSTVREAVREVVTLGRFPESELNRLTLAVDESVTNIMEHAYEHDLEGNEQIEVALEANDAMFVSCIRDWGTTFDPLTVPAPNLEVHIREGRKHGLGIFLIRQIMDDVSYGTTAEGMNELRMVKFSKRPGKGGPVVAAKEHGAS